MKTYLYQINGTLPGGWKTIEAPDHRQAAADAFAADVLAFATAPCKADVFVSLNDERWPNGAPKKAACLTIAGDPATL